MILGPAKRRTLQPERGQTVKLPNGWKRIPLHEIAEVRTGLAKGKSGQRDPVELPYLRVANVQDGHLDLSEIKKITVERGQIERYSLQYGDLLMTEGGDFDKLGRGDVWQSQIEPCLHQNHVFAVRPQLHRVNPFYLAALVGSHYGRAYFLGCAKRSTNLASINSSQLKSFPVLVPPLPEQRQIAAILKTWDKAIEKSEQLLASSRNQKQALMQQLLYCGHRLPGFHGAWKEHRIGDVLREEKRPVQWDDDQEYPLISVRRRSGGAFHRETLKGHEILTKKLNTVAVGDFLISKMQVVHGAMAIVPPDLAHMYVSGSYITLRSRDDTQFDINFFGWLSATPQMYRHAYRSSYGVHIEKMTFDLGMFINERVSFPPTLGEQQAICAVLDAANRQIVNLQRSGDQLREEKRALMQQLLTGKRRVKLDQPAEEVSAE